MRKIIEQRSIVLIAIVIIVAVAFVATLFYLQIIEGETYKEISSKKILRTETLDAPRGEIYDRNGVVLATNKLEYDIVVYRVGLTSIELNEAIYKVIKILEKNEESYYSTIPTNGKDAEQLVFASSFAKNQYLETFYFEENLTQAELYNKLYEKYSLEENLYTQEYRKKIAEIRYEISINGYSLFYSATIAKDISYNSMAYIEETSKELLGIKIKVTPKRVYPYGELAAHILGYVGYISEEEYGVLKDSGYTYNSIIGKSGIEQFMEAYLKGTDGVKRSSVDMYGNSNYEYVYKEAISGGNVTLTIDYDLQLKAEQALKDTITGLQKGIIGEGKYKDASSGAIVVQDVKTGEILALASEPSFDPNLFCTGISYADWNKLNSDINKPLFNRTVQGLYAPGSTYKMVTALAGLENEKISKTERIQDTGVYAYGHHPLCWVYADRGTTHGYVNVSDAIKVSCNCFFYEVGRRVGISEIVKYAEMFGLNNKTGIELVQEVKGSIAGTQDIDWYLGDTLSAAIGQSYNAFTPVEMSNYIATLANGLNKNRVTLIKSVETEDGKLGDNIVRTYIAEKTGYEVSTGRLSVKLDNINTVLDGMKRSAKEAGGGIYYIFGNSSIDIAGKTGTAEVASGSPAAVFAGYAPTTQPEISIIVVIEHGGMGLYAASSAKSVVEKYFSIQKQANKVTDILSILTPGLEY